MPEPPWPALTRGRRHGKVSNNPTVGFELPRSMHIAKKTSTPELDELLTILADANENDLDLAPVLTLAATTGMRRGELSGLRRDRLHLDRAELTVDHAVNDASGTVVFKADQDPSDTQGQPRPRDGHIPAGTPRNDGQTCRRTRPRRWR